MDDKRKRILHSNSIISRVNIFYVERFLLEKTFYNYFIIGKF
jgi:hypothetical protein